MKYIRTKDGRILKIVKDEDFDDEEKAKIPNDCTMVYALNIFGCSIISNKNIVKQADTIEELCDEFVLCDEDIKRCYILDKGFYHRFDEESKKALHIANRYIYGAIFTGKGLIYVAKMGKKGELELL